MFITPRHPDQLPASVKSQRSVADAEAAAGMGMACTRVVERVCAATGGIAAAPSRFEPAFDVRGAGVLWALPALLENGLLTHTKSCFQLPKGYYSMVQIFLLLAFMALARIKTVEQLRYQPPGELGKLLGLDRIPEVRTLREKIKTLSEPDHVHEWGRPNPPGFALSRDWMKADPSAAGLLYVDGHIRAYHGSQTKLPRRYVSRERLCLRGTTDYWVNDQLGRPFFVATTPLTAGLLAMLRKEIVPRLLEDVPDQPSDEALAADPSRHRFVIIFDREGYSPDFFKELWEHRVACQTYDKYPKADWPEAEFHDCSAPMPHGQTSKLRIAERGVRMSNGLWVREVRKFNGLAESASTPRDTRRRS